MSDDYLAAARAVRDAVAASKRRRPIDVYRKTAADVLGLSRLHGSRWQLVIQAGEERGLLRVDRQTLSYPHFIALDGRRPDRPADVPKGGEVFGRGSDRAFAISNGWNYVVLYVIGSGWTRVPWSDWPDWLADGWGLRV
jgi:hypothetical protein